MICKFKSAVRQYDMLKKGDRVIVALSGGADSMSLLHLILSVKDEYGISVKAAHINHCLRGKEADRDMLFVQDACKKLGVELRTLVFDVKAEAERTSESIEECGRRIRYDFFRSIDSDAKIATAHTLSDNEETVLMNLARGTGISGLCGIPAVRGNIIRPLINCSRADVEKYCLENDIEYVHDSTNDEDDYTRNFVRHNLIPCMKKLNPSFDDAVLRCVSLLKSDNDFLENETEKLLENSHIKNGVYNVTVLKNAHISLRKRALVKIVYNFCKTYPEKIHIDLIENLLSSSGKVQVTSGVYCVVKSKQLYLEREFTKEEFSVTVDGAGEYILPSGKIIVSVGTHKVYKDLLFNTVDCDKIGKNLILRNRKSGDKISLQKRNVTKTLKKLFCEENIPESERGNIPVLADEKGVVWVDSFGTDKKYVPDEKSKNVYIIEFVRKNEI